MAASRKTTFRQLTRGIFAQAQYVSKDGYEWIHKLPPSWTRPETDPGVPGETTWLSERKTLDWLPRAVTVRAPLSRNRPNPDLHRLFAACDPTPDAILKFANRWGHLASKPDLTQSSRHYAESFAYWEREIGEMAALISLWDLVRESNRQELERYVRWESQPRMVRIDVVYRDGDLQPEPSRRLREKREADIPDDPNEPVLIAGSSFAEGLTAVLAREDPEMPHAEDLLTRWDHNDVVEPMRYFLHLLAERRLRTHVNMVPTLPSARDRAEILFLPDCLLTSLYVLFVLELTGHSLPPQTCIAEDCDRVFIPANAKRGFCSDTCRKRQKARERRRRERAQKARE